MALSTLAKSGFIANEAVLKTLAKDYVTGADAVSEVNGTFLKILVAHSQREAATLAHKRITQADALGAVAAAHGTMYAIIKDAVTTPDIAADDSLDKGERTRRAKERNRRTGFARSAKSTLLGFIRAGGRLVGLEPATVTKEQLRSFAQAARQGPKGIADQIEAAKSRLAKLVDLQKQEDPEAAQSSVQDVSMTLQSVVTPPKPITGRRRVKDLTLQAEARH